MSFNVKKLLSRKPMTLAIVGLLTMSERADNWFSSVAVTKYVVTITEYVALIPLE